MSKKNILLAITNGLWLIDVHSAEQFGQSVAAVLNGEKFWEESEEDHKAKDPEFLIISPGAGSYFSYTLDKAPRGSVAVISISGPIMKEDNCGDPGTKTYEQMLSQATGNPNITGVILSIDSPGGTVAGTQSLANLIKGQEKPIVTLAEDLMASAAYWIGSSADFVMAKTGTTRIGSIGTMMSFADVQPYWEKQGVKFHNIFATESTEKNRDFLEARKGNYDRLIKTSLDPLNNEFLSAVTSNRGSKLDTKATLNGQVYVTEQALKHGLIDGVGNLNDAVAKVHELAQVQEKAQTNTSTTTMKKIMLLATQAALLAICGATIKEGETSVEVELNEETLDKINAALVLGEKATTDLAAEKTAHEATKKELADLQTKSAGATTVVKEGADKIESNEDDQYLTSVDREKAEMKKKGLA